MRRKKVKTPLRQDELEVILLLYNAYIREWNAREGDLTREAPSSSDEWSPLLSWPTLDRHPDRNVTIVVKESPDRHITIRVAKMALHQSGNGFKNEIPLENVRIAYSESFSPSRNMNANKSRL